MVALKLDLPFIFYISMSIRVIHISTPDQVLWLNLVRRGVGMWITRSCLREELFSRKLYIFVPITQRPAAIRAQVSQVSFSCIELDEPPY